MIPSRTVLAPRSSTKAILSPWLAAAVCSGVALRLWGLSGQILFGDELHALQTAVNLNLGRIVTTYRLADHCMPMSGYDRLLVDLGLALSELAVRAPAVLAGLLSLVVLPLAISRVADRGTTTVFAWFLALSPTLVFYSRIARPYAVIVLLGFSAAACFWRFRETGRARWAVAYAVFAAAAVWSHPGVGPFVAAPLAFGGVEALLGPRPERLRRLIAVAGTGLLFAALVALFLVPAWASFLRLLRAKGAVSEPAAWEVGGAMMLQAGSAAPWAAGSFWALVAVGVWVLWRRNRVFALYCGALFFAQLGSLIVFRPYLVELAVVLNRYLLVALPLILLWAAHGVSGLWSLSRVRSLGRAVVVAGGLSLVATHPYATDPWLRLGPFGASNAAALFVQPPPELPEAVVPEVYRLLGRERGGGAVVEISTKAAWFRVRPELSLARIHRRPVIFGTADRWLGHPALGLRTLVPATPERLAATGARFVILDLDRNRLWKIIQVIRRQGLDPATLGAEELDRLVPRTPARGPAVRFARRMERRLEAAWGPPQLVDGTVRVWDLVVVAGRRGGSGTEVRGRPLEQGAPAQAQPVGVPEAEAAEGGERVGARPAQADARRFVEIADRHRDVAEAEAEVDGLEEELGVEHEVVRVLLERDRLQEVAGVGAEAAVPLAEVLAGQHVLEQGEPAVRQVLDPGHAAGDRLVTGADAVAEDQVEDAEAKDVDRGRDQPGVVLVVRVDHDDIVGAPVERLPVAGLLVAAVPEIPLVADEGDGEVLGDLRGLVSARVVDHDDLVAAAGREPAEGDLQGFGRVVRGHDYDRALAHGMGVPVEGSWPWGKPVAVYG